MRRVQISEVMERSGVKFGTSGARGLVAALTDEVAYLYGSAFLTHLSSSGQLGKDGRVVIAGDLRPSTERIMRALARAVADFGLELVHAGRVPSPALMLYGTSLGIPSIMVTGSHIPEDRNGIKFNSPSGEILKPDEEGIRAQEIECPPLFTATGAFSAGTAGQLPPVEAAPARAYVQRWLSAFPRFMAGHRVGVYGHSAVGRELTTEILSGLGAEVIRLGWSDRFVPVDTEAIRAEDVALARAWAAEHRLFSLVSTDGDSDRPLIADEHGKFLRGDVACVLAARFLGATFVAAPVSCNSVLERSGWFRVERTRIGSPFVIEAMRSAVERGERSVAGYEANGGFLHATPLTVPSGGALSPLATRDPLVVQLALLQAAVIRNVPLSALALDLPPRFTASDRIADLPAGVSQPWLRALVRAGKAGVQRTFPALGSVEHFDEVDGLRVTFASSEIVHLRASGNAPELRCYVEAASELRAAELLRATLPILAGIRG